MGHQASWCLVVVSLLAWGSTADALRGRKLQQTLDRSAFPFTRAYRYFNNDPYSLNLLSLKNITGGTEACFKVYTNPNKCQGLAGSSSICCNALAQNLHKLELEANPACEAAITSVTLDGNDKTYAWLIRDDWPSALFKFAALQFTYDTASEHTLCFTLQDPCPTLESLSVDGQPLRWVIFSTADVQGLGPKDNKQCALVGTTALPLTPLPPGVSPPLTTSPRPEPSPEPSPSPGPGGSPSPVPSPVTSPVASPGVSPQPSPTPSPVPSPTPSPSPSPQVSPAPGPPPPPISGPVVPFPLPSQAADYNQTNIKLQVYDVVLTDKELQVTVQATVQDVAVCEASNPDAICDVLDGLAISVDPEVYGGFSNEQLLDTSKATVQGITDAGPFTNSNVQVKVSKSSPPVVGLLLPQPVVSNSAARVTFVLPRIVPDPSNAPDPSPSVVQVFAWGAQAHTEHVASVSRLVNNPTILNNPTAATQGTPLPLDQSGLNFRLIKSGAPFAGSTTFILDARGPNGTTPADLRANEPLYVRLPLVAKAAGAITHTSPVAITKVASGNTDVTYLAAPDPAQGLVYTFTVPGNVSYEEVCSKTQGTPATGCELQLLGSDGTNWVGTVPIGVFPPLPNNDFTFTMPPGFALPPGRVNLDQTNWEAQVYTYTQVPMGTGGAQSLDVTYQVAAGDVATCKQYSTARRCGPLRGFAFLLDPKSFGSGWDVSKAKVTVSPAGTKFTLASGITQPDGTPAVGVTFDPPLSPDQVALVKFQVPSSGAPTASSAPPSTSPVVLWSDTAAGTKPVSVPRTVFNPAILNDPGYYNSSTGVTNRPFNESGMVLDVKPGDANITSLAISLSDPSAPGAPANLVRPLYLRLFLTPAALMNAQGLNLASPPAAAYYSSKGTDVTWTVGPTPQSTFNYTYQLPQGMSLRGPGAIPSVCLQAAVVGQPDNTCAVQLISSDGKVFTAFLGPEDLGLSTSGDLLRRLPDFVVGAPANSYDMATDTNWEVQMYNASEDAAAVSLSYLVSVGDVATCTSAGLLGCSSYNHFALAIDTAMLQGLQLDAANVTNPDWDLAGPSTPTVNVNNSAADGVMYVTIAEGLGRDVGSQGPTSQLYTVRIPKAAGAGQTLAATGPGGLPQAPPSAALLWGQASRSGTTLGGIADPTQTYNPTILQDPHYAGTSMPIYGNCVDVKMNSQLVNGATQLNLVSNGWVDSPACKDLLNRELQRPMYLRLLLSKAATQSLAESQAYNPQPGAVLTAAAPNDPQGLGGALTFPNLPYWGNSFTYGVSVPGTQALNDVCAQGQVPNQAPDTCVVQLISGGNSTVWTAVIQLPVGNYPPLGPAPPAGLPVEDDSGLSYNEKLAIIICTVVGGMMLLKLCCLLCVLCYRRRQRKWAPAKQVVDYPQSRSQASQPIHSTSSMPANVSMTQSGRQSLVAQDGSSPSPEHHSQVSAGNLSTLRPSSIAESVMGDRPGGEPSIISSAAGTTYLPTPPNQREIYVHDP